MRRQRGYVQQRGGSFRIWWYDANRVRRSESYATQKEAAAELAKRLADVAQGVPSLAGPNTIRFEELAADVAIDYELRDLDTKSDTEARFRNHILPALGNMKATQITTATITKYANQRLKEGAKSGTVNRELALIKRAFRLAVIARKVSYAPHIQLLKESNPRAGFFTREEVDRLCAHMKQPYADFTLFGFLTGWRKDEIRKLKWANIDRQAGQIRLDPGTTKNGEGRVFPISREIGLILDRQPKSKFAGGLVFHHRNGKPILEFRKTWAGACVAAGLPVRVVTHRVTILKGRRAGEIEERQQTVAVRIFHDLRRSAARNFELMGIPRTEIMALMGHKTASIFERYRIVSSDDLRRAGAIMDANSTKFSTIEGGKRP